MVLDGLGGLRCCAIDNGIYSYTALGVDHGIRGVEGMMHGVAASFSV